MNDYTAYLQQLKDTQKEQIKQQLDLKKEQALNTLQQQELTTKKESQDKRVTANVASQVQAKNFAEYLANRGQSSSGLSAQAEMSRNNVLNRDLNTINTNENTVINDINRGRLDTTNTYNSDLASNYAGIEADYNKNMYAEKVRQEQARAEQQRYEEELAYKREQDAIANAQAWARIQQEKQNQTPTISTPYYQGKVNKDALMGTFSNGYQPNNIGGQPLTPSGDFVKNQTQTLNGEKKTVKQTLWQTPDGKKWYWEGRANKYIQKI